MFTKKSATYYEVFRNERGPCKSSMKNHSLFWKESSIIDVWEEAKYALANIRFVSLRSLL